MEQFKISDFYDVEKRNAILANGGMPAVRAYLESVLAQIEDAPTQEERVERFDKVFGHLFSATLDHEVLAAYVLQNNPGDIHEGGLSTNVIRLLKELDVRRKNVPFAG